MNKSEKQFNVLIVDSIYKSRKALLKILRKDYEIFECSDCDAAKQILTDKENKIDLTVIDFDSPQTCGKELLDFIKENDVHSAVVGSSKCNDATQTEELYKKGVSVFLRKSYNAAISRHKIATQLLVNKQEAEYRKIISDQVALLQSNTFQLLEIIAYIFQYRNDESIEHIHNVETITQLICCKLNEISDKYNFSARTIMRITAASALHDLGKVAIDEKILNKPGRLTPLEFDRVKMHCEKGAEIIKSLPRVYGFNEDDNIIEQAYNICLYHHERYDGNGYPRGLKGDEIPISAQIVSIADVYDSLTRKRAYKNAVDHNTALEMIFSGECGCFNPVLLEAFRQTADYINEIIHIKHTTADSRIIQERYIEELLKQD